MLLLGLPASSAGATLSAPTRGRLPKHGLQPQEPLQPQEQPRRLRGSADHAPAPEEQSYNAVRPGLTAPKSLAQWPPPGIGAAKLLQSRSQDGSPPVLSGVPVLPKSVGSDLGFMQFMSRVNKLGTAPPDPFLTGLEGAPTSLPPAATWQSPNPNHPAPGGGNGKHASPHKWRDPFKLVNGKHVLDEQFESFMASVRATLHAPPTTRPRAPQPTCALPSACRLGSRCRPRRRSGVGPFRLYRRRSPRAARRLP
jgi:hypothetical protein